MFRTVRCIVAGDGTVGKSTLVTKLCTNQVSSEYVPTVLDVYETLCLVPSHGPVKLQFLDLPGQEEHEKIRKFCYQEEAQILLLCFSTASKRSYQNIIDFWIPEISKMMDLQKIHVIVVGTQIDLRDYYYTKNSEEMNDCIVQAEGVRLADSLDATYIECCNYQDKDVENLKNLILNISSHEKKIQTKSKKKKNNKKISNFVY